MQRKVKVWTDLGDGGQVKPGGLKLGVGVLEVGDLLRRPCSLPLVRGRLEVICLPNRRSLDDLERSTSASAAQDRGFDRAHLWERRVGLDELGDRLVLTSGKFRDGDRHVGMGGDGKVDEEAKVDARGESPTSACVACESTPSVGGARSGGE